MKHFNIRRITIALALVITIFVLDSCKKDTVSGPQFDLDVFLSGGKSQGYVKFRQDPDAAKIINLNVQVTHLTPKHDYLLQRAVDSLDNNCTSIAWLTLGKGLTPQAITTDNAGNGEADLWRDVTALATGSTFDIHFQLIDAVSLAVVMTSECYQYTVR